MLPAGRDNYQLKSQHPLEHKNRRRRTSSCGLLHFQSFTRRSLLGILPAGLLVYFSVSVVYSSTSASLNVFSVSIDPNRQKDKHSPICSFASRRASTKTRQPGASRNTRRAPVPAHGAYGSHLISGSLGGPNWGLNNLMTGF